MLGFALCRFDFLRIRLSVVRTRHRTYVIPYSVNGIIIDLPRYVGIVSINVLTSSLTDRQMT